MKEQISGGSESETLQFCCVLLLITPPNESPRRTRLDPELTSRRSSFLQGSPLTETRERGPISLPETCLFMPQSPQSEALH